MASRDIDMDWSQILTLAAVGVGVYLVYQAFQGGKNLLTDAATAINNAILPNPTGTASVVMPDGSTVPYESLTWLNPGNLDWWTNTGAAIFTYNGSEYQLTSDQPDAGNLYYAFPVGQAPGGATGTF